MLTALAALIAMVALAPVAPASAACTTLAPTGATNRFVMRTTGQVDCYTVAATSGDRLRVRITAPGQVTSTPTKYWTKVLRPNGTEVCAEAIGPDVNCVVDITGNHTLSVRTTASLISRYDITVQYLNAPKGCGTAVYGGEAYTQPVSKNLACVSFTGAAGDVVRLHSRSFNKLTQELIRPNGTRECTPVASTNSVTGNANMTCTLTQSGTYTVFYSNHDNISLLGVGASGDVQRLNDPVGCADTTTIGRVRGVEFAAGGATRCFRFTGETGEVFRLHQDGVAWANGGFTLTKASLMDVVTAAGAVECAPSDAKEITCVAKTSGPHTLIVAPTMSAGLVTTGHRFSIRRLAPRLNCAGFRVGTTPINGWISKVGETDCYAVDARAGEVLRVRLAARKNFSAMTQPATEIIGPDGVTICPEASLESEGYSRTCTATKSGAQLVIVRDFDDPYGPRGLGTPFYSLGIQRLVHRPTGCRSISYGTTPHTVSITTPAAVECLRFTGEVGDRVRVTLEDIEGELSPQAQVVDPTGLGICTDVVGAGYRTCTLTKAGTHTVLVGDNRYVHGESTTRFGTVNVVVNR